jgi:hypothetical protein
MFFGYLLDPCIARNLLIFIKFLLNFRFWQLKIPQNHLIFIVFLIFNLTFCFFASKCFKRRGWSRHPLQLIKRVLAYNSSCKGKKLNDVKYKARFENLCKKSLLVCVCVSLSLSLSLTEGKVQKNSITNLTWYVRDCLSIKLINLANHMG